MIEEGDEEPSEEGSGSQEADEEDQDQDDEELEEDAEEDASDNEASSTSPSKSQSSTTSSQVRTRLRGISFGALAKAQAQLALQAPPDTKSKRVHDWMNGNEEKLQDIRDRLRELQAAERMSKSTIETQKKGKRSAADAVDDGDRRGVKRSRLAVTSNGETARRTTDRGTTRRRERDASASLSNASSSAPSLITKTTPRNSTRSHPQTRHQEAAEDDEADDDDDDDYQADIQEPPNPRRRTSKHAPTIQPSNRAVGRARTVVPPNAGPPAPRDPRFLPLPQQATRPHPSRRASRNAHSSTTITTNTAAKNYAFLAEYRERELAELRAAAAKTAKPSNNPDTNQNTQPPNPALQTTLQSYTSRAAAAAAAERERAVLAEHRRAEKDAQRDGKKPFFLKRSEVRRRVATARWEEMKAPERTKAVERRRRKVAQKERLGMPWARRGVEEQA